MKGFEVFKNSVWGPFLLGGSESGALIQAGEDPAPAVSSAREDLNALVSLPWKICCSGVRSELGERGDTGRM